MPSRALFKPEDFWLGSAVPQLQRDSGTLTAMGGLTLGVHVGDLREREIASTASPD